MTNEMIKKINKHIEIANESFKRTGWDHSHELRLAKIEGMIDILVMLTGKDYIITEKGLIER